MVDVTPEPQSEIGDVTAAMFADLLSGPTIDIYVGLERRKWALHRRLLRHHSIYFDYNEPSNEPPFRTLNTEHDDTLELPEDDPRGFELLVKWLYQGRLDDASRLTDEAKYDYAVACHKLYLLCEKFHMPRLKNLAIDQYRSCLFAAQLVPDADEINEIYRASPPDSPFRSLMVKIAARQIMDPENRRDTESYRGCFEDNPSFAIEMINAVRHMSGGILFADPTDGDHCAYHDHRNAPACTPSVLIKTEDMEGSGSAGFLASHAIHRSATLYIAELSTDRNTPRKIETPPKLSRGETVPNSVESRPTGKARACSSRSAERSQRAPPSSGKLPKAGRHGTGNLVSQQTSLLPRRPGNVVPSIEPAENAYQPKSGLTSATNASTSNGDRGRSQLQHSLASPPATPPRDRSGFGLSSPVRGSESPTKSLPDPASPLYTHSSSSTDHTPRIADVSPSRKRKYDERVTPRAHATIATPTTVISVPRKLMLLSSARAGHGEDDIKKSRIMSAAT